MFCIAFMCACVCVMYLCACVCDIEKPEGWPPPLLLCPPYLHFPIPHGWSYSSYHLHVIGRTLHCVSPSETSRKLPMIRGFHASPVRPEEATTRPNHKQAGFHQNLYFALESKLVGDCRPDQIWWMQIFWRFQQKKSMMRCLPRCTWANVQPYALIDELFIEAQWPMAIFRLMDN